MAIIGNTVKLRAEFKTFDNVYADPSSITLNVYNSQMDKISNIVISSTYKLSTGIYEYPYVIPSDVRGFIYYEFNGTLEGTPIVGRGELKVNWVGV